MTLAAPPRRPAGWSPPVKHELSRDHARRGSARRCSCTAEAGMHRVERLRAGGPAVRRRPPLRARRPAAVREVVEADHHRSDVGLPRRLDRRAPRRARHQRADLVCNSWGGTIALDLAARYPDRARSLVVTGSMPVLYGALGPLPEADAAAATPATSTTAATVRRWRRCASSSSASSRRRGRASPMRR